MPATLFPNVFIKCNGARVYVCPDALVRDEVKFNSAGEQCEGCGASLDDPENPATFAAWNRVRCAACGETYRIQDERS